jgi:ubiquitin carboxyl-terminal hydrolase 1
MSSSYHIEDDAIEAFARRKLTPDYTTTIGSLSLAVLIGAFTIFKALELLGFPVWLWLHLALQMAAESPVVTVPLQVAGAIRNQLGAASDPDSSDEEMSGSQRSGNIMSSMFGLGSNGLFGKGMRGVTGALSKGYRSVPPGLGNWDNSCYQNSVIQGMASLPSLVEYLSKTTTEHQTLDADSTNGALFELIKKLNSPENHGRHFWVRGKLKSMSTFQQQDAQEYYSKILDELDNEVHSLANSKRQSTASWLLTAKSLSDLQATLDDKVKPEAGKESQVETTAPPEQPTTVPNPLDGLLAQRVGCIKCGYTEGLSMTPFNCLTVPLGNEWQYDIRDCLDEYTNLELIEGVECAKCTLLKKRSVLSALVKGPDSPFASALQAIEEALEEDELDDKTLIKKCGLSKKVWVQTTKSRQAVIARAPKSLVLHVNRSIFNEMTGAQYKNNSAVTYPKVLDLGNWCLGSKPSKSQKPDESVEEWPRDPTKSMLGDEPIVDSPFQYTLRAAVVHFGTHGNGHYVCYRLHPYKAHESPGPEADEAGQHEEKATGEQWWRLSDENVYEVEEEQALRQPNVFMLFYERIDGDQPPSLISQVGTHATNPVTDTADVPLPPDFHPSNMNVAAFDDAAAEVPLPDDDFDSRPPSPLLSPRLPSTEPITPTSEPVSTVLQEPIISSGVNIFAGYATPPDTPSIVPQHEDTEMSEADTVATNYDSEDAPSTQVTSDDDTEADEGTPNTDVHQTSQISSGSLKMKTAGSQTGGEERLSLPMVTAT